MDIREVDDCRLEFTKDDIEEFYEYEYIYNNYQMSLKNFILRYQLSYDVYEIAKNKLKELRNEKS
jgi:hypothetical protein